ncbi:hypothetical protein ONZ45_g7546 [Pleurotus djamor]|nr:hypothetical protein ONZ45_g7546 [Pleurotus djamor]
MRAIDGTRSGPGTLDIPSHVFAQHIGWRGRETGRHSKTVDLEDDDEDFLDLPSMQPMMHPVTGGLSDTTETVDCKHSVKMFLKHLAQRPWVREDRITYDYSPHGRPDRRLEAPPPMSCVEMRPRIHEDITYDYSPHGRPDRRLEAPPPMSPYWLGCPGWHQTCLDTGITVTSPCFPRSKIGRPKSTKNVKSTVANRRLLRSRFTIRTPTNLYDGVGELDSTSSRSYITAYTEISGSQSDSEATLVS